jgi:hypothetical protein
VKSVNGDGDAGWEEGEKNYDCEVFERWSTGDFDGGRGQNDQGLIVSFFWNRPLLIFENGILG